MIPTDPALNKQAVNRNRVVKLYDFSAYAKRREAQRKAEQVEALKERLNEPGAVVELKQSVNDYLILHREVLQQAS